MSAGAMARGSKLTTASTTTDSRQHDDCRYGDEQHGGYGRRDSSLHHRHLDGRYRDKLCRHGWRHHCGWAAERRRGGVASANGRLAIRALGPR